MKRKLKGELYVCLTVNNRHVLVFLLQASMLPNYGYNKGGFLAAAHLLSDPNTVLKEAGLSYVGNFLQSSPWHVKVCG